MAHWIFNSLDGSHRRCCLRSNPCDRVNMSWAVALVVLATTGKSLAAHWAHSAQLDANFAVFWTPAEEDITFEVQVHTLGYVGLGFSADGAMAGADMVVGWVRGDEVFFQDRHAESRSEPVVDPSQDYDLLRGYENGTHTVLRFRRRYDTCDPDDFRITNDTMRMLFAYHDDDLEGFAGSLPYHGSTQRGYRSLYLTERVNHDENLPDDLESWDLKNSAVTLPTTEDTLYWCKIFKLPNIRRKHHMVRYEPLLQPDHAIYLHHVIVYECRGDASQLEDLARQRGLVCYQPNMSALGCNNVVVAWATGSQGFTFPPEAGYPLDPQSGPRYYMMETHYTNPTQDDHVTDSSGVRLHYTPSLRPYDAGVLSVGIDPNWRHIVPPGQPAAMSEGHCISDCTRQALPPEGISVFGVVMHTHLIGRKVKFRQIRNGAELPPIAADNNYDFNYQEYRRLQQPVKVYPGDHLIAECVYNSEARTTITLGGLTTREEMCLVYGLYWPRVSLALCHSLPSLPTVLQSLGIHQLWPDSSPVRIKSPPELADMTLENRLITYDWENNFVAFQETTRRGSFKPLCWTNRPALLPGTEEVAAYYPNISKPYQEVNNCHNRWKKPRRRKKPGDEDASIKEEDENFVESDEEEKTKVYSSISLQESSRLNSSGKLTSSCGLIYFVGVVLNVLLR